MLGVKPCEALMVGDRCDTDGGALSAGLQFIHLIPSAGSPDTGAAAGSACAGSTLPVLAGAGSAARLSPLRLNNNFAEMDWKALQTFLYTI